MKYFVAICTCIILLCGFGNTTDKNEIIREYQTEAIASISTLSDNAKTYHQLAAEKRYDAPNMKLSEESCLCLSLRTPILIKTSKFISTIRVLCNYRTLLPEEKASCLYPSINDVKSSCRYFIYTLGHILI